jgi:hypothetical protein
MTEKIIRWHPIRGTRDALKRAVGLDDFGQHMWGLIESRHYINPGAQDEHGVFTAFPTLKDYVDDKVLGIGVSWNRARQFANIEVNGVNVSTAMAQTQREDEHRQAELAANSTKEEDIQTRDPKELKPEERLSQLYRDYPEIANELAEGGFSTLVDAEVAAGIREAKRPKERVGFIYHDEALERIRDLVERLLPEYKLVEK